MARNLKKEEKYIVDQSQEISLGEAEGWGSKIFNVFPAFQSRNYQLYFSGQSVSLIGTWLQVVAQGWLVLQLTNSAFLVGLVAAIATLPTLLFSLFGGAIVDRFSKRKILLLTQTTAMVLALILGILTTLGLINVFSLALLAFLLGTVTAIDAPARQSFVVEMVGKEKLTSAIALNAGIFNSARVIGPSIAGLLIAVVGIGGTFIINGLSYTTTILALKHIRPQETIPATHPHPLTAIKNGISYSFNHPILKSLLIFTAVVSIFGWSYTTILPVIAKNTFHVGAAGLGYLYAASGLGALTATFLVSALSKKVNRLVFIFGGNALFALSLILFSWTTSFALALPILYFAGLGLLSQFAMMNTTIQHLVEDKYRGRVMSIYTLMFLGLSPLGNFQVGFLSEKMSPAWAIRLGAVITLVFGLILYFQRHRVRDAYQVYKVNKDAQ